MHYVKCASRMSLQSSDFLSFELVTFGRHFCLVVNVQDPLLICTCYFYFYLHDHYVIIVTIIGVVARPRSRGKTLVIKF